MHALLRHKRTDRLSGRLSKRADQSSFFIALDKFSYLEKNINKMGCAFSSNHVRVPRILKRKKVSVFATQIIVFQQEKSCARLRVIKT